MTNSFLLEDDSDDYDEDDSRGSTSEADDSGPPPAKRKKKTHNTTKNQEQQKTKTQRAGKGLFVAAKAGANTLKHAGNLTARVSAVAVQKALAGVSAAQRAGAGLR